MNAPEPVTATRSGNRSLVGNASSPGCSDVVVCGFGDEVDTVAIVVTALVVAVEVVMVGAVALVVAVSMVW